MMRKKLFILFLLWQSFNCFGQQNINLSRPIFLVGADFGYSHSDILVNDITYKNEGIRLASRIGYFIGKETIIGINAEYENAWNNYKDYESIYAVGAYMRQFFLS